MDEIDTEPERPYRVLRRTYDDGCTEQVIEAPTVHGATMLWRAIHGIDTEIESDGEEAYHDA